MTKFIDPLTDFGFKRIFANEEHKEITIDFLNSILQLEVPIISIEFQNLEKGGYNSKEKKSIFDIFCIDKNDREFIVELQRADQKHFVDRSLFYTSKQIVNMGIKGTWDYEIKPIYFIGIMDFSLFPDEKYIRYVSLKDEENLEISEKLKFAYVELKKFDKKLYELQNWEKWIFFLKHLSEFEEKIFQSEPFENAFEIAYFSNLDGEDLVNYELDLKDRRDRFAEEKTAFEKGELSGEKKKQLEIAKNLLDVLDIKVISLKTGLSVEEINEIK
ncbi:putative transposase or invertase [Thiovulum sp. ES]|nr:putative transposase or invertase [Thiovulum sp. ES]